jgi:hypothetical protein
MKLYHATTRTALDSIKNEGLCVRYAGADKRIKAVWLHTRSTSAWALLHTQRRHAASLEELVVVEVNIPRSWLKRFKTGLWYTSNDIPPARLGRTIDGTAYAASAK